ncbi:hypothetical protein ACC676_17330 [Rhizobium ruizarguesonis]|nr:hypothetical protein [Rhizobium leguminosarum]
MELPIFRLLAVEKQERINEEGHVIDDGDVEGAVIVELISGYAKELIEN